MKIFEIHNFMVHFVQDRDFQILHRHALFDYASKAFSRSLQFYNDLLSYDFTMKFVSLCEVL
jgi:hypothetical protein